MHVLLQADQRPKQNHKDVPLPAHPQEFCPSVKESGLMLSQKFILQSTTLSKQLSTLLRPGHLPREDDGAIELRRREYLRNDLERSQHWSNEKWKSAMTKRRREQENISVLW